MMRLKILSMTKRSWIHSLYSMDRWKVKVECNGLRHEFTLFDDCEPDNCGLLLHFCINKCLGRKQFDRNYSDDHHEIWTQLQRYLGDSLTQPQVSSILGKEFRFKRFTMYVQGWVKVK